MRNYDLTNDFMKRFFLLYKKDKDYLTNGTKECFVYQFDLLQDEPRSNSFRRSRDSKDVTDSYTRKLSPLQLYQLSIGVLALLWCKAHQDDITRNMFCFVLILFFDFMLITNNKQQRNNISQQNILSTICTESLVNKT